MTRQAKLLALEERRQEKIRLEKESLVKSIPIPKDGVDGEKGDPGIGIQGLQGIQGIPGKDGKDGRQGLRGLKGGKGEKGDPGAKGDSFVYRGEWKVSTKYFINDVVEHAGSSYVCLKDHTSRNATEPDGGVEWLQYWGLLAKRGQDGKGGSSSTIIGSSFSIPELTSDPSSPTGESAWVLDTITGGAGVGTNGEIYAFAGLGFPLIGTEGSESHSYQFSYYTNEGTIIRTSLT